MKATTQDLINLFGHLRSPNPDENQIADTQLQELCTCPDTILSLFNILDNVQDINIRRYSFLYLAQCFRSVRDGISQETYSICKNQILNLLQNEQNALCAPTIVLAVRAIVKVTGIDSWPELKAAIFSGSLNNLYSNLLLLEFLLSKLSEEELFQNQQVLLHFGFLGITSDDMEIKSFGTFIVSEVFQRFPMIAENYSIIEPFRKPLCDFFFGAIELGNIWYINSVIWSIQLSYEKNIFIFPFEEALPELIKAIHHNSLDREIKLLVNLFIVLSLWNPKYLPILNDPKLVEVFFNVQRYVTELIYAELQNDADSYNLYDVISALYLVLSKISAEDEIVSFTMRNGQSLLQENKESSTIFAMLLFCSAVKKNTKSHFFTDIQLNMIYGVFISALNARKTLIQKISGILLQDHFEFLIPQANSNMEATISAICIYIDDVTNGDMLLPYFVQKLENIDPIFDFVMNIAVHLINSGVETAQNTGYFVMSETIKNSDIKAYIIFENLYQQVLNIVKQPAIVQPPHSYALKCLAELINLSSNKIEPHLDEFMEYVLGAFINTEDEIVINDILLVIYNLTENLCENLDDYFGPLLAILSQMEEEDWNDQIKSVAKLGDYIAFQKLNDKIKNAAFAIEIMSKMAQVIKDDRFILNILTWISNFINLTPIPDNGPFESVFQAFLNVASLIQQNNSEDNFMGVLKTISKSCIETFLKTDDENIISCLLPSLANLAHFRCLNPNEVIQILDRAFNIVQNTVGFGPSHKYFNNIILLIYKIFLLADMNLMLPNLLNIVTQCLSADSEKSKLFSINLISGLKEVGWELLKRPELSNFFSMIPNYFIEGSEKMSSAVVRMMRSLLTSVDKSEIIVLANQLCEAAKIRLTNEINNDSILRDNLIAFITTCGGKIIGDNFPFREMLPLVIRGIPISCDLSLCDEVYSFLSGVERVFSTEEKQIYIKKLVEIIAVPYKKLKMMKLEFIVWNSMIMTLNELPQGDEFVPAIAQILCQDTAKINLFVDSLENLKAEIKKAMTFQYGFM